MVYKYTPIRGNVGSYTLHSASVGSPKYYNTKENVDNIYCCMHIVPEVNALIVELSVYTTV